MLSFLPARGFGFLIFVAGRRTASASPPHGLLLRKQAPALGSPLASPPLLGANRRRPSLALPFLRQPRHETE
jgi:hypothetical protein